MSNIIDYMKWRGDLTFAQDSFNEIDNLILSQLVYVELNNIVPGDEEPTISLLDAAKLFFKQNNEQELLDHVSMTKNAILVFKEMAKSVRFKNIQLSRYVNDINEQEQSQFSAITIKLPDNSTYIAFSGTDATLVGWHEDFNMLYLKQTPGQEKSLAYLNTLKNLDTPLRLGGHSKGGNFAIYAGMYCEKSLRDQIIAIYNNDGPGFSKDVVASAAYQNLLPLITTIVPESSVVGRLFEHQEDYIVIKSENKGLKQHDAMSWEVLGNHFVHAVTPANQSLLANQAIREWIALIPREKRKEIVEAVFQILDAAGIETVDDFLTLKLKDIRTIIQTKKKLPRETSDSISDAAFLLIKIMIKTFTST